MEGEADATPGAAQSDADRSGRSGAPGGVMHVVVQRCTRARLLVDAAADEWTEVGRGLAVFVSFASGAPPAGDEADRLLRQAAKSILGAPLSTSEQWKADHTDAESVAALCRRGEPQAVLVVPQASLVCKLELGDKSVKYHRQCAKDDARRLYEGFVDALRSVARELIAGPAPKHNAANYEALQAKRAAAAQIAPDQLFKTGEYEGKYSRYDDRGVPTHDAEGAELAKSALKKLEKVYAGHAKKYAKAAPAPAEAPDEPAAAREPAEPQVPDATQQPQLPEGACLPEVRKGTFGGRQGFEMTSGGPFTHMFVF
mmetsp:Transcript_8421/g.23687  ORF Transcript_8421/g.23687 Transcript_8421/m.23687 type:complete len:313 (+) Transcript_8421:23-961(+)